MYLALKKKLFIITLLPAMFMTFVCTTFILISNIALSLSPTTSYTIGIAVTLTVTVRFFLWHNKKFTLDYAYGKEGKASDKKEANKA